MIWGNRWRWHQYIKILKQNKWTVSESFTVTKWIVFSEFWKNPWGNNPISPYTPGINFETIMDPTKSDLGAPSKTMLYCRSGHVWLDERKDKTRLIDRFFFQWKQKWSWCWGGHINQVLTRWVTCNHTLPIPPVFKPSGEGGRCLIAGHTVGLSLLTSILFEIDAFLWLINNLLITEHWQGLEQLTLNLK